MAWRCEYTTVGCMKSCLIAMNSHLVLLSLLEED